MKKTTVIAAVTLVLALVLSTVPALADEAAQCVQTPGKNIDTKCQVVGGANGSGPIIKAKWEQDTTSKLEDGDPKHKVPGAQFLPPCEYQGRKYVEFWVVVTDPEGVSTVDLVEVNVYHPDGCPEYGSWKFQLILQKVDKFECGIPAYEKARAAGLVSYNCGIDDADVSDELYECLADVYMATGWIDYHQPAGCYKVVADACDNFNNWASASETNLTNYFTYIPVPALELDFCQVDYGTVTLGNHKMIGGDKVFGTSEKPTCRNIGNTALQIMVAQDDMGFGYSGIDEAREWNVTFDCRLGWEPQNTICYDPCIEVGAPWPKQIPWQCLPNTLPLCNTQKMDFSIQVIKSAPAARSGNMLIGWACAPCYDDATTG